MVVKISHVFEYKKQILLAKRPNFSDADLNFRQQVHSFHHVDFHLPTVDANLKFPQTVVNLVMTDDLANEESTTQKN